jgi:hypothetical protein
MDKFRYYSDLQNTRLNFRQNGRRSSVQEFITKHGSYNAVLDKFGGKESFFKAMKAAGFSKSYISRWRKKLKELGL